MKHPKEMQWPDWATKSIVEHDRLKKEGRMESWICETYEDLVQGKMTKQ